MGKKLLSLDALLLFLLVLVRVRVDTLVTAVIPRPTELVAKVPVLGGLLSPQANQLLADWMADPVSALLITATFALTAIYLLLDLWQNWPAVEPTSPPALLRHGEGTLDGPSVPLVPPSLVGKGARGLGLSPARERRFFRAKLVTLYLIILLITGVGTLLVVGLRHVTDPAQYAHDGGVLMTESAIDFILAGKNPYVESFRGTPMEKAFPNGPGLSHYPYLPWAFVSSVPFYLASKAALGWYDQRFVYLLVFALTLLLVPKLASRPGDKLALVMIAGLNPIMGNDLLYGMNDIFVVFWLVLAVYLLKRDRLVLSAGAVGLAAVTKGTVWPFLPFYLLYLYRQEIKLLSAKIVGWTPKFPLPFRERPDRQDSEQDRPTTRAARFPLPFWERARVRVDLAPDTPSLTQIIPWRTLIPLIVTPLIVILPFAIWNLGAMIEDTWSYNMGNVAIDPLPIRGWGLANVVLALGWVQQTTDSFPFWIFEGLFALPFLAVLLLRQWRHNTLDALLLGYGLFFLVFVFVSRTMNANYIGYALTFVGLGYFADGDAPESKASGNPGITSGEGSGKRLVGVPGRQ